MGETPPRLAVDANGFVWRVYDEHWSMPPVNPDNSPIPEPVTYYVPTDRTSEPTEGTVVPMTAAAVPDPRFRDQLAEALREVITEAVTNAVLASRQTAWDDLPITPAQWGRGEADRALAADGAGTQLLDEVEARVQAADNQRAAEELRDFRARLAAGPPSIAGWIRSLDDRAAALASPAPAPRAEEGQR